MNIDKEVLLIDLDQEDCLQVCPLLYPNTVIIFTPLPSTAFVQDVLLITKTFQCRNSTNDCSLALSCFTVLALD